MDLNCFDASSRKTMGAELYIRSWLPELDSNQQPSG